MIQTCKLGSKPELTQKRKILEFPNWGNKKPPGEMPHRREVSLAQVLKRQDYITNRQPKMQASLFYGRDS
jgi:hypothetical protein